MVGRGVQLALAWAAILCLSTGSALADSADVKRLLQQLADYPHTKQVDYSEREVIDHEIGLGAMQKLRGEWHFKHSERLSGTLRTYTWLIVNGFSSAEVMAGLLDSLAELDGASELYACEGRACGRAVQWANQVFGNRVLYGREDLQRYSVYAIPGAGEDRLLAYSAERTADRQYLHVEWLQSLPPETPEGS